MITFQVFRRSPGLSSKGARVRSMMTWMECLMHGNCFTFTLPAEDLRKFQNAILIEMDIQMWRNISIVQIQFDLRCARVSSWQIITQSKEMKRGCCMRQPLFRPSPISELGMEFDVFA